MPVRERRITTADHGHLLTNVGVWSPDGTRIVHDVRSDAAGTIFDGDRIMTVDVRDGTVETLYRSCRGACCGVVTWHPSADRIVFIHGPEDPTPAWSYGASRRCGVVLELKPGAEPETLDACELTEPFVPGALRGGSHVHTWSADGSWIAFTYEDQFLVEQAGTIGVESNRRQVGVALPDHPVSVSRRHPRNRDGSSFCVVVTDVQERARPRSDELLRCCSDAWIGTNGYVDAQGVRRSKAIAFQGRVPTGRTHDDGTIETIDEVFVVDLPDDLARAGERPLEGTATTRPAAPSGTRLRRLTWTDDRPLPGLRGPRHWLRSSPDGSRIATLMPDERGIAQLVAVDPASGAIKPIGRRDDPIGGAFTWSPDGSRIAHPWRGEVAVTDVASGRTEIVTERPADAGPVRPEACVWSPDGRRIAFARPVRGGDGVERNQICVVEGL